MQELLAPGGDRGRPPSTLRVLVALVVAALFVVGGRPTAYADTRQFIAQPAGVTCDANWYGDQDRAHVFHYVWLECDHPLSEARVQTTLFEESVLGADTFTGSVDAVACQSNLPAGANYSSSCALRNAARLTASSEYRPAGGVKCGFDAYTQKVEVKLRLDENAVPHLPSPDPWALEPDCDVLVYWNTGGSILQCTFYRGVTAC